MTDVNQPCQTGKNFFVEANHILFLFMNRFAEKGGYLEQNSLLFS